MANFKYFESFQGYTSCTTEAGLTKLDVHQRIIVMHTYFKFHENPFSGYLVMAPDGQMDGLTDGHGQINIHPPSAE